ncbi:hypothetical protein OH77DRAFT_1417063 [Trametes cingulata]|nr:hypothetical protein OH77DRAFT_1417063 [Trametes cingulata]
MHSRGRASSAYIYRAAFTMRRQHGGESEDIACLSDSVGWSGRTWMICGSPIDEGSDLS